jgi:hypothetical protein
MITKNIADTMQMWLCTEYGVTMSAAYSAAFCARRFAAANHKDSARISFSRCRTCARGSTEYKLAGGEKYDDSAKTINTPQAKLESLYRVKRVMNNKPSHTQRKDEELHGGDEL